MTAASHLCTRVLRLRLKDKHAPWCRARSADVNFVWNYCNETSHRAIARHGKFLSAYDLDKLTSGATKEGLELHSQTVQAVSAEYVKSRKQHRKAKLRWRVSDPRRSNYSLGWVPFKASAISYKNGQLWLAGQALSLWDSYGLSNYELGAGSISEDARGRWYISITVQCYVWPKPEQLDPVKAEALGIDLGLKELTASSDGTKVEAQRFYRDLEPALAAAQRAGKKQRVRSIHAKIANRRRDHLHKLSTSLVRERQAVFVGNVNAQALAQTPMAKSVLDAGWSTFRTMLRYKCDSAGVWFAEVDEKFSTQECSSCHARTGPKGREGLSVRNWTCSVCGTSHDRDVNAALNIKARGLAWLEQEFSEADSPPQGAAAEANEDSQPKLTSSAAAAAAGHGRPVVGIPVL